MNAVDDVPAQDWQMIRWTLGAGVAPGDYVTLPSGRRMSGADMTTWAAEVGLVVRTRGDQPQNIRLNDNQKRLLEWVGQHPDGTSTDAGRGLGFSAKLTADVACYLADQELIVRTNGFRGPKPMRITAGGARLLARDMAAV